MQARGTLPGEFLETLELPDAKSRGFKKKKKGWAVTGQKSSNLDEIDQPFLKVNIHQSPLRSSKKCRFLGLLPVVLMLEVW